ncbi:hypothetical protein LJR074_002243 [Acidovorax sp. LjRoot74]|uniref:hypothetical protein n=1 Tax=Acidovorax sp. LjRoot74 TaxID=3342337 RepID=UPI003ECEE608
MLDTGNALLDPGDLLTLDKRAYQLGLLEEVFDLPDLVTEDATFENQLYGSWWVFAVLSVFENASASCGFDPSGSCTLRGSCTTR